MGDEEQSKDIGRLEGQVGALKDGQDRLEDSMLGLRTDIMNMGVTLGSKIDDQNKRINKVEKDANERIGVVETNAASMKTKLATIAALAAVGVSALLAAVRMAWGAM